MIIDCFLRIFSSKKNKIRINKNNIIGILLPAKKIPIKENAMINKRENL